MRSRHAWGLLLLLTAPQAWAQSGTFIQSETRLVLVDTVVTDKKGKYLRDLTQKDFKVFEDGKEQAITSFSHETGEAGNDARKHYTLFFFDDSTAGPTLQSFARQAARNVAQANAGANNVMAVAEYGASLKVTQNFTDDSERLAQTISSPQYAAARATGAGAAAQNEFANRGALRALQSIVASLTNLPGRKTLIFVSGGYPASQATLADITSIVNAANRANVAIYPIVPAIGQTVAPEDSSPTGPSAGGRRQRGGGGRGGEEAALDNTPTGVQQVLYSLATGTGGFSITSANDIAGGLAKAGKEQEEYYILGFTPQKSAAPGACHTLKVRLDKSGEVRSRTGYCEEKTQDVLSGTPTERDLEARVLSNATPTVTGASLLIPFFYTAANTARVNVALELPPGAIQFAKDKGRFRSSLNVVGIATLPDGNVKGRFSDSVKLEFADKKEADAFSARPFHYEKQFKMGPGEYDFKLVFSASAKQFGRFDMPLKIEPWDPAKFAMSPLALSRSARPAKEPGALDLDTPEDSVPLTADGVQIIPTGSNRFRKSDKCYFYTEIYEPALAENPAVGVRMEFVDPKTGAVTKDLGVIRLKLPAATGNPAVPVGLSLPLAQFEPGAYRLRVTAIDSKQHQAVRTVDFVLEN